MSLPPKALTIQLPPNQFDDDAGGGSSSDGSGADGVAKKEEETQNAGTPSGSLKRKRNLPGNPDPDAEVVALSPRTLLATNRFVCEICNKGFQRDQNLQLHRRGHNLPWKLRQRTTQEVRKKVYVCPEPTCIHHDPSRALGDLTGIKKHFCRKHGEKKYKCEKCSKKYAVQSDWKAHMKTCGTREYRCDCGTLFSRRDSFITHRAFCDALADTGPTSVKPEPGDSAATGTGPGSVGGLNHKGAGFEGDTMRGAAVMFGDDVTKAAAAGAALLPSQQQNFQAGLQGSQQQGSQQQFSSQEFADLVSRAMNKQGGGGMGLWLGQGSNNNGGQNQGMTPQQQMLQAVSQGGLNPSALLAAINNSGGSMASLLAGAGVSSLLSSLGGGAGGKDIGSLISSLLGSNGSTAPGGNLHPGYASNTGGGGDMNSNVYGGSGGGNQGNLSGSTGGLPGVGMGGDPYNSSGAGLHGSAPGVGDGLGQGAQQDGLQGLSGVNLPDLLQQAGAVLARSGGLGNLGGAGGQGSSLLTRAIETLASQGLPLGGEQNSGLLDAVAGLAGGRQGNFGGAVGALAGSLQQQDQGNNGGGGFNSAPQQQQQVGMVGGENADGWGGGGMGGGNGGGLEQGISGIQDIFSSGGGQNSVMAAMLSASNGDLAGGLAGAFGGDGSGGLLGAGEF
ncbi:unnamed protein product [Closterium sp. Yama58-4]|nr:unnamed protein product [Closterium sp. Yama58-4]